jgi:hypothetical protein
MMNAGALDLLAPSWSAIISTKNEEVFRHAIRGHSLNEFLDDFPSVSRDQTSQYSGVQRNSIVQTAFAQGF